MYYLGKYSAGKGKGFVALSPDHAWRLWGLTDEEQSHIQQCRAASASAVRHGYDLFTGGINTLYPDPPLCLSWNSIVTPCTASAGRGSRGARGEMAFPNNTDANIFVPKLSIVQLTRRA